MIALDTNVLLRILVRDEADEAVRQQRQATRLIDEADATGETLFVSDTVLCEAAWTLRARYKVSRAQVRETLAGTLQAKHLVFASTDRVARAVSAFARGPGDFADYLTREHAREAGCEFVATIDRALLREDGFRAP